MEGGNENMFVIFEVSSWSILYGHVGYFLDIILSRNQWREKCEMKDYSHGIEKELDN